MGPKKGKNAKRKYITPSLPPLPYSLRYITFVKVCEIRAGETFALRSYFPSSFFFFFFFGKERGDCPPVY